MTDPKTLTTDQYDILIVDDVPENLKLLGRILDKCGYRVRPAPNGRLALESVAARLPDLILLDVKMPEMDGYEVCRRLKANEQSRNVPVIFISAYHETASKVEGFKAGGVDYIAKPFEREEVLARVKSQLRLRKLTEHLEEEVNLRTAELTRSNQQLQEEVAERQRAEEALCKSEERYRMVFENSPVSIWEEDFSEVKAFLDRLRQNGVSDIETYFDRHPESVRQCAKLVKIIDVNRAALNLHDAPSKEELFAGLVNTFTPQSFDIFRKELIGLWNNRTEMIEDAVVKTLTGEPRQVTVYYSVCPGYEESLSKIILSLVDITERRRNERINAARFHLMQFAVTHSLDELFEETINEAEKVTESLIGFYVLVDDDQKKLILQDWSTRTKAESCKAEGKDLHYHLDDAGVWADCVRERKPVVHNDYMSLPHRKGMPEGHAEVVRELVVPVMREGKIKAIMGVGNKPADYSQKDVEAMSLLADLAWDIVERKRAEQQITLMSFALNGIHEAAFLIDENACLQYVNEEACRLLGYSRDELLTMTVGDINPEHRMDGWSVHWSDLKEHGTLTFEGEFKTGDGRLFPVEINAYYFEYEDRSYDLGLVRDITERKRMDNAIKKSLSQEKEAREKVEVIFKAVAEGLIFTDRNNRIQLMSPSAEKMFGTSMKESSLQSVNAALDQPALTGQLNDLLSQKRDSSLVELEHFSPRERENRIVQAHSSPVRDVNGEVNGVITLFRDISREREMEQMKSEFICTAAHELRTPLTAVKGFVEVLLNQKDLDAEQKAEFLSIIHEKSMTLERIVDDLLDISRIEAGGQISLTKTCSEFHSLFGEKTGQYRREYPDHRFETVLPEQPLELWFDREKMVQVLDNLVSNAVKFTEPESLIKLACEVGNGEVIIAVEDEGLGMTPRQAERVFDKFYRVDASDTGKEGLGLGMHIAKNIVEAHEGRIWVKTEPGKGTKVFLTLPLAPSSTEPADGK